MNTTATKRPLPTSGFSAGRAPQDVSAGRVRRAFPANSPRAAAEDWEEELAGIEAQLKDETLTFAERLNLENRQKVLQHRLLAEVR